MTLLNKGINVEALRGLGQYSPPLQPTAPAGLLTDSLQRSSNILRSIESTTWDLGERVGGPSNPGSGADASSGVPSLIQRAADLESRLSAVADRLSALAGAL